MLTSIPFITPFFLALRNIRTRRWRTGLTVLGIVLGVGVVLAIQVTNQSTLDSLRRVFDRTTGQASLVVVPLQKLSEGVPEELVDKLEDAPEVEIAAPSIQVQTLLSSEAESWQIAFSMQGIAPGNLFLLYGIDPQRDPAVRVYQLNSGRMPDWGEYELVLPEKLATEKTLQLGDDLVILTPTGEARLRIVGLLAEEGVAMLNDGVAGFAPLDVVQELFNHSGALDEIALKVASEIAEDPYALEGLKDRLEARVGDESQVMFPAARGELVSQMLATYQFGLTFFSLIAIFVGAFLIYNTFSMTIVERTREIGMLRAIGMNRWNVLRLVLAEAVLLSLAGSILGVGAGLVLARGLMRLMGGVVVTGDAALHVPVETLLQSIAVGLGVTLAAALIPGFQAARISPLEALRIRSRSAERINPLVWISGLILMLAGWAGVYRVRWPEEMLASAGTASILLVLLGATLTVTLAVAILERLARPLATGLYHAEGRLGSANVRRSVGRTTLTVASLMVALTMIISITSLAFSFEKDMSAWIDSALGGDLFVRSPIPMQESFARQLYAIPGVEVVTPARILEVKASSKSRPSPKVDDTFFLTAIDPQSYRRVSEMQFAAGQGDLNANWGRLAQGSAVFISNMVAERYNLDQGGQLLLQTPRGEHAFQVAAVVMDFTGQGGVIYVTYNDLRRWFAERGADRFIIKVAPGYSIDAVADEIKDRFQDRHHISIQTTQAFKQSILDLVDQSFRLFDVLSLIGVIIGGLGVINTLTMNVIERQREIGGLRSLGMMRVQVLRMVLAEALALGVMGGVYGLLFGYAIAKIMILGLNLMVGYDLAYQFTPRPYLIGALIALVVVQAAAVYPARRAAALNVVEAIKHE